MMKKDKKTEFWVLKDGTQTKSRKEAKKKGWDKHYVWKFSEKSRQYPRLLVMQEPITIQACIEARQAHIDERKVEHPREEIGILAG